MQVFIRTLSGKTNTLEVESDQTVESVKESIYFKVGYRPKQLTFAGKQLKGHHTLANYNVQKESTIHPVFGLRGGGTTLISDSEEEDAAEGKTNGLNAKTRKLPYPTNHQRTITKKKPDDRNDSNANNRKKSFMRFFSCFSGRVKSSH